MENKRVIKLTVVYKPKGIRSVIKLVVMFAVQTGETVYKPEPCDEGDIDINIQ